MRARPEILLIRHGMPNIRSPRACGGAEFLAWRHRYGEVDLHPASRPPRALLAELDGVTRLVTSELRRAVQSGERLGLAHPPVVCRDLSETALPLLTLPWVRMSADAWVALARLSQRFGYTAGTESIGAARRRARRAATDLAQQAQAVGRIAVVGHGTLNRFVAEALVRSGWTLRSREGREFWRWQLFEAPTGRPST